MPTSHLWLVAEIAADHGVPRERLLAGTGISSATLDRHDLRVTARQANRFAVRTMTLTKMPGLGLEFGLRSRPTIHGPVGLAALSSATLQEALQLLVRFHLVREQDVTLALHIDGPHVILQATDNHDLGRSRRFVHECLMVGCLRLVGFLIGEPKPEAELWFDWPEPAYFKNYREHLPPVRFGMPGVQLRLPLTAMARRPVMADPGAMQRAVAECEREMALLGYPPANFVARVRAELHPGKDGYPDLESVARRLFISTRTLKRKLGQQRETFQALLDEARRRDAERMLGNPDLDIQQIALALGYTDPPSFTRAFRRWTGHSPTMARRKTPRPRG